MKNKCSLCKSNNILNLSASPLYVYCPACRLAWLKKKPKIIYKDYYYQGNSSSISNFFSPLTNFFYFYRKRYGNDCNLWIDVGAGDGSFLKTVCAKKRLGVEISKIGCELIKKKGIKVITSNEFLKRKNLKADIITFWHSLEHMDKPEKYLLAAKQNLNPDGKIIIAIPNFDSWELNKFSKYWFHLAPSFHLWHFSPTSIKKILNNQGIKIDKIDYWSIEHHLAGLIQSFINMSSNSENILHSLVKRTSDFKKISFQDIFWCFFWLTLGLPIIFTFLIINALLQRSGAIVIVASLDKRNQNG